MTAGALAPSAALDSDGLWSGVVSELRAALLGRAAEWHPTRRRACRCTPSAAATSCSNRPATCRPRTRRSSSPARLCSSGPAPHQPGGCPRCLARRWQAAQPVAIREAIEFGTASRYASGPAVGTDAVVTAVVGVLATRAPGLVRRLDLRTLAIRSVALLTDPSCPDCGSDQSAARPVAVLEPSPRSAGSFRARGLHDYDLPDGALVNPVCGVIGRGLVPELALPSTAAIWGNFATKTHDDMYEIYWAGHANSYADSVRIGLLEGLERYAGMSPRNGGVTRVASWDELRRDGVAAVDPRECGLYAEEFYADTDEIVPFTTALRVPWLVGDSLRDRHRILVPEIIAYYHSSEPEQRFVQECSNGCASGSSLTEAAYCGIMELIERDAFLLSWYGQVPLPEIDGRTSRRASTRTMIDRLAMHGYRARFFDARVTFDIPVVVGVAQRMDGGLGAMVVGGGCGLDPEDAIAASLVEIATDSLNQRRRVERDLQNLQEMAADFDKVLRIHDHPMVFGLPEMARHADFLLDQPRPARAIGDVYPHTVGTRSPDLRDDLDWCVAHLAESGFDTVVVDQTAPEQSAVGVHTASVIVPGLLPLDFGWYRQRALHMPRMRTALRTAGLVDRDLDYDDLHLVPHPFP